MNQSRRVKKAGYVQSGGRSARMSSGRSSGKLKPDQEGLHRPAKEFSLGLAFGCKAVRCMEVSVRSSGWPAAGWEWPGKAGSEVGGPARRLMVWVRSHEGPRLEASEEEGTDLRNGGEMQWIGLCNGLDKGNGKEEIKDEIEQWNSLYFEALFKRVLGSLSFWNERIYSTLICKAD